VHKILMCDIWKPIIRAMEIISSTSNGQIFVCPCNRMLQLEFGNLFLVLTYDELGEFAEYINAIDYKFYCKKNQYAQNRRKLLLRIGSKNVYLAATPKEFLELRELLSLKSKNKILDNSEIIDFKMIFN
jgi:hypothetical protein